MKKLYFIIPLIIISLGLSLLAPPPGPNSWTQLLSPPQVWNDCIAINPTNQQIIFAGTNGTGVYMTTDGGSTWGTVNNGLTDLSVQTLAMSYSSPTTLYAGCISGGMFKTTNSGTLWTQIISGLTDIGATVQTISVKTNDPNTVVIAMFTSADPINGVYKTTNGGTSWTADTTGILHLYRVFLSSATSPTAPNTVYLGGSFSATAGLGVHIYKSYDFGSTWINISHEIDTTVATGTDACRDLSISTIDSNTVLAGRFWNTTNGGPWLTTNAGANWVQRSNGFGVVSVPGPLVRSVKIRPGMNNEFYLGGNAWSATSVVGGVWRTTDAGLNWVRFNTGAMDSLKTIRSLNFRTAPDSTLYAGSAAGTTGIFAYTFISPPPTPPTLIHPLNNATGMPLTDTLMWNPSGGVTYRVQVATDAGFTTLILNDSTITTTSRIISGLSISTIYYWRVNAKNSGGTSAYSTVFNFTTGAPPAGPPTLILPLNGAQGVSATPFMDWSSVATATNYRIQISTDFNFGISQVDTVVAVDSLHVRAGLLLNNIIYYWHVYASNSIGNTAYSGLFNFRTSLIGVSGTGNVIPKVFMLYNNYPNPFNPDCNIRFDLPNAVDVKLGIYNVLGQEVDIPVNNHFAAGAYSLKWNGANFPSGVYFYKITAGNNTDIKKMVLIK
jgi:hypothetical protein